MSRTFTRLAAAAALAAVLAVAAVPAAAQKMVGGAPMFADRNIITRTQSIRATTTRWSRR